MTSAIGAKIEAILRCLIAAGVVKDAKSNGDRYSTAVNGGMSPYTTHKDVMEIARYRMGSINHEINRSRLKSLQDDSKSWLMDKTLHELDCDISSPYSYDSPWETSFHRDSLRRLSGLSLGMSQKFHNAC